MTHSRFRRRFGEIDKAALLAALATCRRASIEAGSVALFDRKDVAQGCQALQNTIDDLAGVLTGNREHFWLKAHSSPPTGLVVS